VVVMTEVMKFVSGGR